MVTINKAIKGINGLPLADIEARQMLANSSITNKFNGKKWAIFGDSISQPNTDGLDKYYNIIANKRAMSVTSYAKGGSGYFKGNGSTGYGTGNIIDSINNASSDFDIVSFMAGINERSLTLGDITDSTNGEPTTLCGAVKKSIELAIEKYPNAQIFLITPTPGTGDNNPLQSAGNMTNYVNKQKEIAKMYNIPVIDLYFESNLRPWNTTNATKYYRDYCHLLLSGHQYISQKIENEMNLKLIF